MAIIRAQLYTCADSTLPVDRVMITPHFRSTQLPADDPGWNTLGDDLLNGWKAYLAVAFQTAEMGVKIYDAEKAAPNYPKYEKTIQLGVAPVATQNRETAICLSFYGGQNRPRQRGRLYLPCFMIGVTASGARPTAGHQQKAADLVPLLSGLGGLNIDWGVYSRVDKAFHTADHWWVDNSWDVQRRRGVKPTARLQGTTSG